MKSITRLYETQQKKYKVANIQCLEYDSQQKTLSIIDNKTKIGIALQQKDKEPIFRYKGQTEVLPETAEVGDVYIVGDQEYVYTEAGFQPLGALVNLNPIEEALAAKADQATVEEALAAKADQETVDEALSGINQVLTTKADQATVEEALAAKADQEAINEALAIKANTSDVYSKAEANQKFLTEHQSLSAYYTKEQIDQKNKTLIDIDENELGININNNSINLGSKKAISPTPAGDLLQVNIGLQNQTSGLLAFAHGKKNKALNRYAVAFGYQTIADGQVSHAEGMQSEAHGNYSHAEGNHPIAYAQHSHAQGYATNTYGKESHAQGYQTIVSGRASHAEGYGAVVSADFAHGEGYYTHTNAIYAHAEGTSTAANAQSSHAQGWASRSQGIYSHAEGKNTVAFGEGSHTEGSNTITRQQAAHAEGIHTEAIEEGQHVEGKYNIPATGYQHIVGAGNANEYKNIQTLDWNGNEWLNGNLTAAEVIANGHKLTQKANNSNLTIVNDKLNFVESLLYKILEKNIPVISSSDNFIQENTDLVIAMDTPIEGVNTISGNSINIKELEVDNGRLNMVTSGDVLISNLTTEGNLPKATSNAQVSINTSEYVKISNSAFEQNSYNAIEIGLTNTSSPKSIIIDNINFLGTFANNVISIFNTEDNAVITISNCKFVKSSNPVRISNRDNVKLTLNLINCDFGETENRAGVYEDYAGIVICQDYTSTSVDQVNETNRFAPDKVTINFINCTHKGNKISFTNREDVCGTKSYDSQLVYVYADAIGDVTPFDDGSKYPTLTCI